MKISDSNSLWNYPISPGWTKEEVDIFKIALTKYGIGKWNQIRESGCLPNKTNSQMNIQTQKLLGQQSLSEFMGLRIDLEKVYQDNLKILKSLNSKKKFIVNEGNKLTREEKEIKRKENKEKYGLSKRIIRQIKIPKMLSNVIGHHLSLKQIKNPMNKLSLIETNY